MSNYDETVRYLYNLQREGIKLGLDNSERLLQILGSPHTTFRSVHIAGTNGKGSTATIIFYRAYQDQWFSYFRGRRDTAGIFHP
jgi:folylpolyglutamate synthase/dihydropteroate synthase